MSEPQNYQYPPQGGPFPPPQGFGAQQGFSTPPPTPPKKRKGGCLKVFGIGAAILVVLIVGVSLASSGSKSPSGSSTSSQPAATAQAGGTSGTTQATQTAAQPAPANVMVDRYGTFDAISKSGSSSSVINLPAGIKAGMMTATYSGSSNFAVSALDANNQSTADLLVNTIGKYSGTTAFGLTALGEGVKLKVETQGAWTIKLQPLANATVLDLPAKGTGDQVLIYNGGATNWAITNKGKSNFVVTAIGGMFPDLLVNEIGDYSGTLPVTAGPVIVTIQSEGAWTMAQG